MTRKPLLPPSHPTPTDPELDSHLPSRPRRLARGRRPRFFAAAPVAGDQPKGGAARAAAARPSGVALLVLLFHVANRPLRHNAPRLTTPLFPRAALESARHAPARGPCRAPAPATPSPHFSRPPFPPWPPLFDDQMLSSLPPSATRRHVLWRGPLRCPDPSAVFTPGAPRHLARRAPAAAHPRPICDIPRPLHPTPATHSPPPCFSLALLYPAPPPVPSGPFFPHRRPPAATERWRRPPQVGASSPAALRCWLTVAGLPWHWLHLVCCSNRGMPTGLPNPALPCADRRRRHPPVAAPSAAQAKRRAQLFQLMLLRKFNNM